MWSIYTDVVLMSFQRPCTVNLPNFEHVKKGSSKSTTFKLVNLVHEDVGCFQLL